MTPQNQSNDIDSIISLGNAVSYRSNKVYIVLDKGVGHASVTFAFSSNFS